MRRPTNPLALAVLTLLDERPMHPYEMSSTLRERRKEDSIRLNYGSLYSVVDSLVKKGLIRALQTTRQGRRPERTVYEITDAGHLAAVDWLSELLAVPTPQFTDFEAALSLAGALPPDEVRELLRRRQKALTGQLGLARSMLDSVPPQFPRVFVLEGEYQVAMVEAELRYVTSLVADLESGDVSGLDLWRRLHELRDAGMSPDQIAAEINPALSTALAGWADVDTTTVDSTTVDSEEVATPDRTE